MAPSRDHAALQSDIRRLGPWFHNLHLPGGVQTAPDHRFGDFPAFKWAAIADHLPADLSGQRVLDIGCNAGFYSFALAERGARVTAIDTDDHYLAQGRWAADVYGARNVTFRKASVYDVLELGGPFDVVMFMGVFYHLRYPLLALDMVAALKPSRLVFQSLTVGGDEVSPHAREDSDFETRQRLEEPGWPRMAFIEKRFANDPTNWWAPNHACIEAMLRSCGYGWTARPAHEIYVCAPCATAGGQDGADRETPAAAARGARGLLMAAERAGK